MPSSETVDTEREQEAEQSENGQDGHDASGGGGRRAIVRAAAIAAASGATALAAKKLSDRQTPSSEGRRDRGGADDDRDRKKTGEPLVGAMLASGWDAAKDSIIPIAEDAASRAGEYVAASGPELLRDTLVPRFISGFEKGRRKSGDDE